MKITSVISVISVLSLQKVGKIAVQVVSFCITLMIVYWSWVYFLEYQEAKANRSNAMQVSNPVVHEQIIPITTPDFFTEYRLERDRIRSERTDVLREIIKNAKSEEAKQQAQDAILKMTLEKKQESEMENLIKAKGFGDALVFTQNSSASAVVKSSSLSKEEVIQVAEVISRIAGIKPEDITVSAKP
ncbi:MAG TPA: SpoIIIAH-like family protein [Methylomusa anaerophila]|uniref:SpoIIIAH-like protein n=1 Tax=Methylomusa anaerophila TaxID=1930071 RepID=A0A348APB5_9FIRM|nr:SpoIIIAH-like family protein [Methylomusa anaerophila]BBB92913.1 SpoIIIAH-like protein [Methylomusa anaerophila]HML87251.1 SpoIIIAH-like family protein [Methylomusa anaerophila]